MAGEPQSVDDDERLYRRIVVDHFDAQLSPRPSLDAFLPGPHDDDGLSVFRAGLMTPEEVAATGRSKRGYYIGVIDARAVRAMGLSLMVDDEDPAHVSIAEINSANAGTDETYELAKRLSEVCKVVRNERFPGTPGANP